MKFLSLILLIFIILPVFGQSIRHDQLIAVAKVYSGSSSLALEAKFAASVTEGLLPLKVQFTDQSTGSPTTWKWEFGDGDSSTIQNPAHTYKTVGAYTVRLTISDGKNNYTLEKKDYIRANLALNACDTMHFPLPKPLTYYTIPNGGYVSGNNLYGDKAMCDYFDNLQTIAISGVFFDFCKVKKVNDEKIAVCIWKPEFTTGTPGKLIFSDTVMLSTINNNIASGKYTTVTFSKPVQLDGPFFAGLILPVLTGDTLALWSTPVTKIPVNTAWVMTVDGKWSSAQDLWPAVGEQKFIVSNAIFPKICRIDGIARQKSAAAFSIYPDPVSDNLRIVLRPGFATSNKFRITDMSGNSLLKGTLGNSQEVIDVQTLRPGIYLLQLEGDKLSAVQKFVKK